MPSPVASPAKPHAVLVPYPAQGHLNPMMQLSKNLAAKGVHITLVTTEYAVTRMLQAQKTGIQSADEDVRLVGIPDGLPPDSDRNIFTSYSIVVAFDSLGGAFDEVIQKLVDGQPPVTCIIGDCAVSWWRDVANKHKIPKVLFWPQSAAVFTIYSHVDQIISNGFDPFKGSVKAFNSRQPMDLVTCIPGLSPLHPADLPFESPYGEAGLQLMRIWIDYHFGHLDEFEYIIGNSFYELEPQVCKALQMEEPNFHVVGPLLPSAFLHAGNIHNTRTGSSFWEEDECSIEWLDMQPLSSVLYVSFGSLTRFSVAQIHEIALGLTASQQRFLWVIRKDSIVEEVTNVLEALPEGFLDQIKDQGKIIQWAPQSLVLSHPAVSGFFTHCGWNSTLESMTMGVPLLGWPQMLDQITNCWLIVNEWKIGLELKRNEENETERGEVERAVRILMEGEEGEEMRRRAAKLGDAARRAVKEDSGSSERSLQHFVDELKKHFSKSNRASHSNEI